MSLLLLFGGAAASGGLVGLIWSGPFIADIHVPGQAVYNLPPGSRITVPQSYANSLLASDPNWWTLG